MKMDKIIEDLRVLLTKHEELLKEHEKRIGILEGCVSSKPLEENESSQQKSLSVKEFLRSKKPNSNVQKTITIGYYLEKFENMSAFNASDIRNGFKAAREPEPSNIQAFINQNISNGHIMDFKEKKNKKKAYVLTNSGEEYVEKGFKKPEY
jgi:hypothetical protein